MGKPRNDPRFYRARRNLRQAASQQEEVRDEPAPGEMEFEGVITEQLRDAQFKVQLNNGTQVLAYMAGKMRRFRIRVTPGDRVLVAMSAYDTDRGRIVLRYKT